VTLDHVRNRLLCVLTCRLLRRLKQYAEYAHVYGTPTLPPAILATEVMPHLKRFSSNSIGISVPGKCDSG
jgi:hypothetical protein